MIPAERLILRVAEAAEEDRWKRRARLDREACKRLQVTIGDILELQAGRTTAVTVRRGAPSDEGLGIIRLDELDARNAGAEPGEKVAVTKAMVAPARKITVRTLQEPTPWPEARRGLKSAIGKGMRRMPVTAGDRIAIRRTVLGESPMGLEVLAAEPGPVVLVGKATEVEVLYRE